MARNSTIKKRVIAPDYKYNSVLVSKLIRYIMRQGKIDTANKIVYKALEIVSEKLNRDALECLNEAIDNIKPRVQIKSRRSGSMTLSVPMEISQERAVIFALRWVVKGIEERVMKNAIQDLAKVIIDSVNKTGFAVSKKIEMHKQAEANKVYANYRW